MTAARAWIGVGVIALLMGGAGAWLSAQSHTVDPDRFLRRSLNGTPYRIFVPSRDDGRTERPLVLFLHGGAGRGRDNERQLAEGNGMLAQMFAAADPTYHAFVVAPQTDTTHDPRTTMAVLDEVRRHYRIDAQRIYLVGQSLGGYGALDVIAAASDRFAAAIVIAAGGDPSRAAQVGRVPIWFLHGERDDVVSVGDVRQLVAALKAANSPVRFTEYAGEGHGLAWLVVRERGLMPWLFAHAIAARSRE